MFQRSERARNLTTSGQRKEDEFVSSFRSFAFDTFDKFYRVHIPVESIKELPDQYMYLFGFLSYAISFILFFIFIYSSYSSAIQQPYMSLQSGPNCNSVPIAITTQLQVDQHGYWQNQLGFSYVYSKFEVSFDLFQGDVEDYAQAMNNFYENMFAIGKVAVQQNLALNVIYWIGHIYTTRIQNSEVFFSFMGSASTVYNLKYNHGQVSSVLADCPLDSYTFYDYANSALTTQYNYSVYLQEASCNAAINPFTLGYVSSLDGNILAIKLDVNAFQVAMAVNLGIVRLEILTLIPGTTLQLQFYGGQMNFTFGSYFDPRVPQMEPVNCISNVTGGALTIGEESILQRLRSAVDGICFVNVGDVYGLPVFNHWGSSINSPEYCDCAEENGYSIPCQQFNFISSLLLYNVPLTKAIRSIAAFESVLEAEVIGMITLLNQTKTYDQLNREAYNASFASAFSVNNNPQSEYYNELLTTPAWRRRAYEFCTVPVYEGNQTFSKNVFETCSLVTFSSYDPLYRSISLNKYQLYPGSCSDSFSIPSEQWAMIVENPPVNFTEDYFACTYGAEAALLNAVGIAQGNVQVVLPALMFASLPLLYAFLLLIGQVPPKEEYKEKEKEDVIDSWSTQLLRLRDGKTRGLRSTGVLIALGKELIRAAKEEGGYPDSDDSDDEDEERMSRGTLKKQQSRNTETFRDSDDSITAQSVVSTAKPKKAPIVFRRHKLDVFTKRIRDEREAAEASATASTTKAKGHIASSVSGRLSFFGRGSRFAGGNPNQSGTTYGMWRMRHSSASIGNASMHSNQHLGDLSMVILGSKEADVRILNGKDMNPDIAMPPSTSPPPSDIEIDSTIEMLVAKLHESLVNKPTPVTPSRETEAYQEARKCSLLLRKVAVDTLLKRDDCGASQFLQLTNAITLHASIALGIDMKEISQNFNNSVAYDMGGRFYTPKALMELCQYDA